MSNRGKCMVIVCLMGALLAGCGEQDSAKGPAQTGKRATLRLWHAMVEEGPRRAIQAAVDRYQSSNPLTTVVVEVIDAGTYEETLNSGMKGPKGPDVFFTLGGCALLSMAKGNQVVNLKQELAKGKWGEQFVPAALEFCSDENGTWGVPVDVSFVPVWYNTEICKDHRVKIPKTLGQFVAACQDLDGEGMTPLALGNKERWPGGLVFAYLAAREGGAQLFMDAVAGKAGAKFDDPAFVKAGNALQRFVRTRAFPSKFNELTNEQAAERFVKFQAAMCMMGPELVKSVQKGSEKLLGKMDCFPFPVVTDGKGDATTLLGGVDCGFAVSKGCANPDRAIMLLRYLASPETAADWVAMGRIPGLKMDETMLKRLPAPTQKAYPMLKNAKRLQPYYHKYLPSEVAEKHMNIMQELLALKVTPEEAAARMAQ